jgi:hypothetical protein
MKDCSNNVRTIYVNALNGNITYNSRNVPVYGQSPFVTPPEQYAIITNITEVADNTNNSFSNIVEVTIEVYSEQNKNNNMGQVDNIANQILNILIPDTQVDGFDDADFEVFPMARTLSTYLPLWEGDNYISRKILTIRNLVNQK